MNNGLKFPLKFKLANQGKQFLLKEKAGLFYCYDSTGTARIGDAITFNKVYSYIKQGAWIVIEEEKAKHPHDEVIRAWLDGKTVQLKYNGEWFDLGAVTSRKPVPYFDPHKEYRIKPEDPDVYVSFVAYDAPVGITHIGVVERVKMKLSEFNKISNPSK